jgi:fluoroquinolone resistance protein
MLLAEAFSRDAVAAETVFRGEDVSEFRTYGARFRNCHFAECDFRLAVLRDCEFIACRFSHCDFREAEFHNGIFIDTERQKGAEWAFCNLGEAKFFKCNMSMGRIVKSEAYLLSFADCSAVGLSFDAEVHRTIARKTMVGGVRFQKTKLQYAQFHQANYEESVFEGCDLRDCSFSGSNLTRVSFRGSSINNTDFARATLDGASLVGATFDELDLASMFSFRGMTVSRDQHENLLQSLGILTADRG